MFKFFKKSKIEFVVAGLGNPGPKYENTRHNAGFTAIDYIVGQKNISNKKLKHHAEIFETEFAGHRVMLIKPLTFMNLSGDAVSEILNYHKIPAENLIVIADDIFLPVGKLRIRRKGSAGSHNGLKDIILKTGCDTFVRIKLGIGEKPKDWDLAKWVLSEFSKKEKEELNLAVKNAYNALELIVCQKIDSALNKFNS